MLLTKIDISSSIKADLENQSLFFNVAIEEKWR